MQTTWSTEVKKVIVEAHHLSLFRIGDGARVATGRRPCSSLREQSDCFTLEVIHGGFFVGFGSNRAYVDGHEVCFDDYDGDTWSSLWLDDMTENLGYESAGRIGVYWLLPGMQINKDGLRLISENKDALSMIEMVKKGHRFLMVYLDHEAANKVVQCDDIVENPVANLPPVISPSKKGIVE
uniref:Uncharacterized protein n=1 Tax=Avena sativa TaxID=4498 RepID=A0ACD5YDT9_AVESA